MIRFYILPIEIRNGGRGPRHFGNWGASEQNPNPSGIDANWGMMDYGLIDAALVAADVTQAQHEELMSNPDVESAPENIDQNISDIAIPKIKSVMEQLRIPAEWVDNNYTYRQILRMIAGLFQFAQRHHGLHNEQLIDNTSQLDLRWNEISQDRQTRIIETADDLGYDYSVITNQWTIRQILKHLGDQWGATPFYIGGHEL